MTGRLCKTNLPGLFDLELSDGRVFTDLTVGQLRSLATSEGWRIDELRQAVLELASPRLRIELTP